MAMKKRGFTLVEVLVAMSIIGLLSAIALPALHKIRESARRSTCLFNMKQLGIAVNNYIASANVMPIGNATLLIDAAGRPFPRQYSVLGRLTPYLDHFPLFNSINFDVGLYDHLIKDLGVSAAGMESNATVLGVRVREFLCPTDGSSIEPGRAGCNYRVNLGSDRWDPSRDGPFMNGEHAVGPQAIGDGMGNTIAFSEKPRGSTAMTPNPRRDMYQGGWGGHSSIDAFQSACSISITAASPFSTSGGQAWLIGALSQTHYNHTMTPNNVVPDCMLNFRSSPISGLVGARSDHDGGVVCAFCDGSVKFIRNEIDQHVWRALGTRAGGETIDGSLFD